MKMSMLSCAIAAGACWLSSTTFARAEPLRWSIPVDVRVTELRHDIGPAEMKLDYTLLLSPRVDGPGFFVHTRGLPLMFTDGERKSWRVVEAMDYLMPLELVVDDEGVIEEIVDAEAVRNRYRETVKAQWKGRDAEWQRMAANDRFIDTALQRFFKYWPHIVGALIGAPDPLQGERTIRSEPDEALAWQTVTRVVGPSPIDPRLVRLEAVTTIAPEQLREHVKQFVQSSGASGETNVGSISRRDVVVADVERDTLRPIHVEATTITTEDDADGKPKVREYGSIYDLHWVPRVADAGGIGTCRTTLLAVPRELGLRGEGATVIELGSCGTGLPLEYDNATVRVKGTPPLGAMAVTIAMRDPERTFTGEFGDGERQAVLSADGMAPVIVTREPGVQRAWADFENMPANQMAMRLIQHGGASYAGEELVSSDRVTMHFDAIPVSSIMELLASLNGNTSVHGEFRGRIIAPKHADAVEEAAESK